MDKYERKVRVNQIISLIDKGEYGEALEIADTIDWRTEKSIKTLRVVSEVYKINRRYEDAFNVLTIAYEKEPDDPIKRKIVYDLCEIAIKLNQYAYAVKYMKEFAALSPNDPGRYVLQYKLLKVTGAEYAERIEVLEEFKQNYFGDFREKWAYELAQLYHATGQSQQCINACDEIILWFVKGPYVTKAKELKNSYQSADDGMDYQGSRNTGALNNTRPDYSGNESFGYSEDQTGYYTQDNRYSESGYDQSNYGGFQPSMQIEIKNVYASNEPTIRMPDQQISDAAYGQAPDEVSINIDKYSTINLQAELKANLDDLSQRTGEPILQREESIPEPDEGMTELFDTTNMSGAYQDPYYPDQTYGAQQYQQPYQQQYQEPYYPDQAYNGSPYEQQQYDAQGVEGQPYDLQPETNQMTESEEPKEYERKFPEDEKAEPVVAEVDRAAFVRNVPVYRQSPSGETLYRTEETQKPIVIKKTDFGESLPRMPQQYRNILSEGYDGQLNLNVPDSPTELEKQITGQMDLATVLSQWEEVREESKRRRFSTITPSQVNQTEAMKQEGVHPARIPKKDKTAVPLPAKKDVVQVEDASQEPLVKTIHPEEVPDEKENDVPVENVRDTYEAKPQEYAEAPQNGSVNRNEEEILPEIEEEPVVKTDFTEDEREIYSPFISIGGMSGRLLEILPRISMTGCKGNIIITGNEPTLRMALAQSFARDMQLKNSMMGIKVAKISAETFNTKDIEKSLRALDGNVLVIERAGRLSPGTVSKMLEMLKSDGLSLLVILEDSKNALNNLPLGSRMFQRIFSVEADIPRFTNDDLVRHAQDYAREREYQIDDLAILALYRRIDELQTADHLVTAEEVEKIMDGAIRNVNKKNMTHFMDVLFAKRYNEDDLIIIREKDFEKK